MLVYTFVGMQICGQGLHHKGHEHWSPTNNDDSPVTLISRISHCLTLSWLSAVRHDRVLMEAWLMSTSFSCRSCRSLSRPDGDPSQILLAPASSRANTIRLLQAFKADNSSTLILYCRL